MVFISVLQSVSTNFQAYYDYASHLFFLLPHLLCGYQPLVRKLCIIRLPVLSLNRASRIFYRLYSFHLDSGFVAVQVVLGFKSVNAFKRNCKHRRQRHERLGGGKRRNAFYPLVSADDGRYRRKARQFYFASCQRQSNNGVFGKRTDSGRA